MKLSDHCKAIEQAECQRASALGKPVYVRIDGHRFSRLTKHLDRPYDRQFAEIMIATMAQLVDDFHALVGYTQSDEISLIFHNPEQEILHGGRFQKIATRCASKATAVFNYGAKAHEKIMREAEFDARAYELPGEEEIIKVLHWRQMDAARNAVSMAARAHYSHKQLMNRSSSEMLQMLSDKGVDFDDYWSHFRRGTWAERVTKLRNLTDKELAQIPEKHRPDGPVMRSSVECYDVPILSGVEDKKAAIFRDQPNACRARPAQTEQRVFW